jgi:cytidine deaminase
MIEGGTDPSLSTTEARELLRRAVEVRRNAYAPYSGFPVGAALLAADGAVYPGVNVENAAYGLTTCAERSAVVRAMSEGVRGFRAIAIVGPQDHEPCAPCGSCRQVLHEIDPDLLVVMPGSGVAADPLVVPLAELLPGAFGAARLVEREP